MKTIYAVFTAEKLSKEETEDLKPYSFNVEGEVNPGDLLETSSYKSKLQVTSILDNLYSFFDFQTGFLVTEKTHNKQGPIRKMVIGKAPEQKEENDRTVYAKIVD